MQLPRTWLTGVLSAAGLLPAEYRSDNSGLNKTLVDGLGLDSDVWFAYLETMPDYPQAEAYVRAHASRLDAGSLAVLNEEILKRATRVDLDDWNAIHAALIRQKHDGVEPLVPAVSSRLAGPAGLPHLPRLWIKALLRCARALPAGWKSGLNCGLDKYFAASIGLDLAAAIAFVERELPTYLEFEAYVVSHIAPLDDAAKDTWRARLFGERKAEEQARADCIEAGLDDLTLRDAVMLNDLVDWKHTHDQISRKSREKQSD
jgi:hypothetical protein